jgi:hypothetical protein
VTVAQIFTATETPASILESEVIPALDRILLEYSNTLRSHHRDELRRSVAHLEELFSELESAFDGD